MVDTILTMCLLTSFIGGFWVGNKFLDFQGFVAYVTLQVKELVKNLTRKG